MKSGTGDARYQALLEAAQQLDEALATYERAAHGFLEMRLDSRKNLGKSAEMLAKIADIDDRMSGAVGALVAAVGAVRDSQQKIAEEVHRRALEVLERKNTLEGLIERLQVLGREVTEVGAEAQSLREDCSAEDLRRLIARVTDISERAHAFAADAQAQDFADLAAEGHALREQLLSVKERAARLDRTTPQA